MIRPYFLPLFTLLMYLFLYIPIVVLIIFSFNSSPFSYQWTGFSLRWYEELFESVDVLNALKNSLVIACSAVALSIAMGVFLVAYGSRHYIGKFLVLFYANLAVPEVVLAAGLISFFWFFSVPLGLTSLIATHTLIGLGYVVPIVQARFAELDDKYTEASLDLGATYGQTLFRVIIPLLFPALLAAALLVFIISLDDFVLSFFCAGATTQTLPMYIFAMIRSGSTPVINALSTILLGITSVVVLLFSLLQVKKMDILQ